MAENRINDLRIYGVPDDVQKDLHNIAKNQGTTLSSLLKPELRKIRDSYPEHMRKEKSKD